MLGFLKIFGRSRHLLRADKQAVWDKNAAALRAAATPEQRDIIWLTAWFRVTARAVPVSRSEVERGTYQPATELAETSGRPRARRS